MTVRLRTLLLAGLAASLLGACDYIRFPGDNGPPPKTPEAPEPLPPGAPGPPPPSTPVSDPYGNGDTPEENPGTDTPVVTDPATPDTPSTDDPATPDGSGGTPAPDGGTSTPDTPQPDTGGVTDPVPTPDPLPEPEPAPAPEPKFSYFAPGSLLPGTGQGAQAQIVHAPGLVFPIKSAPAYLQTMVFNPGGGGFNAGPNSNGSQCDARNFAYPWRDNFCETRTSKRNSPLCPVSKIHQGQDIRVGTPADCKLEVKVTPANRERYEAVAVADGVISNVGTYAVTLRSEGAQYKYMHLNMAKLKVVTGQAVKAGDLLGYVSNDFGGTPTVLHLHFEILQNTAEHGWVHVPPYLSLVEAYERREAGPGTRIEPSEVAIASAPIVIPEGMEIIE